MSTQVLRKQRADLANRATAILTRAERLGRDITAEEREQFQRMSSDIDRLKFDIDQREWFDGIRTRFEQSPEPRKPTGRALRAWMQATSAARADSADIAAAKQLGIDLASSSLTIRLGQAPASVAEARTMTTTTITSGAALVAEAGSQFVAGVESAWLSHSGVREVATVHRTKGGADVALPTCNDTTIDGEIVQESTTQTDADPAAFGLVKFGSYLYSSKVIKVPIALARDAGFNLDAFLGDKLGERIARIQNKHWTTGTGSSQPYGMLSGAADSSIVTASPTTISYGELVNLEHSVDPAYRARGRFMAHDTTIQALKLLLDTGNRPIWQPGVATGAPDTLNNRPFVVNQAMPSMAATNKTLLFGDFSKYNIRDVEDLLLVRLNERYIEKGIVAFLLYARSDGGLIDAGTHPVKYLTQHA